jgi:hypothetical protein
MGVMAMRTKNKTQENAAIKLKSQLLIRYDVATKGQSREQTAMLQLAELNPKEVKVIWHDFRYFTVKLSLLED